MRIGIVTPVAMFPFLSDYFSGEDKKKLKSMPGNDNGPAPSLLAKGFIDAGHFVRIFTFGAENLYFKSEKLDIIVCNSNDSLYRLIPLGEIKDAFALRRMMSRHIDDLDVIHAHWTYKTALAAKGFANKKSVFCTIRDWAPVIMSYLPNNGGLYWKLKKAISNRVVNCKSINLIANSPYTKELVENATNRDVYCILNPIDESFLVGAENSIPQNFTVISIMSSIDERKNPFNLLLAFKEFRKSDSQAKLIFIINDDDVKDKQYYKSWLSQGLLDGVTIYEKVPHQEIIKYLDQSTVMMCPSREETFGNIIVEAMSRKLIVIGGKKSGAIPYLLKDGELGYLCNVDDFRSIYETMIKVKNELPIAQNKAENAYNFLKNNLTLSKIVDKHIKLFESKQ